MIYTLVAEEKCPKCGIPLDGYVTPGAKQPHGAQTPGNLVECFNCHALLQALPEWDSVQQMRERAQCSQS